MLNYILRTIICNEFELNVGKMQHKQHLDGRVMYGFEMNFSLHEANPRDNLYPHAQLLLFAPANYVGVYYRESKTRDEYGPWQHLSYHDSCWRDDGVDRFIARYEDRVATLGWHDGICNNKWYSKREISPEFAQELREITKKARG